MAGLIEDDVLVSALSMRIQEAGRLDQWLRRRDGWYGDAFRRQAEADESREVDWELQRYFHFSVLWVLDVFELARTIDVAGGLPLTPPARAALKSLRKHLASIRAPLAKFQRAGERDSFMAWPVLVYGSGAGWNVGGDEPEIVSRQRLGDEFLEFLEAAVGGTAT
ncbi:MAG TPA: hypothetical protein VFW95_12515 [Candidatus Limnocylindria bacterium]|nr:hypothetical protein [Candidatus Limnocylindria bacterium]